MVPRPLGCYYIGNLPSDEKNKTTFIQVWTEQTYICKFFKNIIFYKER